MPIRLTWSQPSQGTALGYVIYKRIGAGPIDIETDFLTNVPSSPLTFDDSSYDPLILETVGYTYGISAVGVAGQGPFSNFQTVNFNFDVPASDDNWNVNIPFTDVSELDEMWEFPFIFTSNQLYQEEWESTFIVEHSEGWEPPILVFTLEHAEPWEFGGIVFTLEHSEDWENEFFTPIFEHGEDWEPPAPLVFTLEHGEDWES